MTMVANLRFIHLEKVNKRAAHNIYNQVFLGFLNNDCDFEQKRTGSENTKLRSKPDTNNIYEEKSAAETISQRAPQKIRDH